MAADLGSLMRIAPLAAAQMVGEQHAVGLDKTIADTGYTNASTSQIGQNMDIARQKLPGQLEHQSLQNQGLQAGLGGIEADTLLKQLNARKGIATETSDVETHLSKNKWANKEREIKEAEAFAGILKEGVMQTRGQPAPLRSQYMAALFKKHGMDPNDQNLQMIAQMTPEQIEDIIKRTAMASREYLQATAVADINGKYGVQREQIQSGDRRYQADTAASSRLAVAQQKATTKVNDIKQMVLSGKLKLNEMPAAFTMAANMTSDPDERAFLLQEAQNANQLILDKANAKGETNIPGMPPKAKPETVYGDKKPRGDGTAANPIKLD